MFQNRYFNTLSRQSCQKPGTRNISLALGNEAQVKHIACSAYFFILAFKLQLSKNIIIYTIKLATSQLPQKKAFSQCTLLMPSKLHTKASALTSCTWPDKSQQQREENKKSHEIAARKNGKVKRSTHRQTNPIKKSNNKREHKSSRINLLPKKRQIEAYSGVAQPGAQKIGSNRCRSLTVAIANFSYTAKCCQFCCNCT